MEKNIIGENGISYTLGEDGMYYPDLSLEQSTEYVIGRYGRMRCEYLKEHRRGEYIRLLLEGELNEYLHQIDETGHETLDILMEQMKKKQGVPEQLKAEEQMVWVGMVNNIRSSAEEMVLREIVYQ